MSKSTQIYIISLHTLSLLLYNLLYFLTSHIFDIYVASLWHSILKLLIGDHPSRLPFSSSLPHVAKKESSNRWLLERSSSSQHITVLIEIATYYGTHWDRILAHCQNTCIIVVSYATSVIPIPCRERNLYWQMFNKPYNYSFILQYCSCLLPCPLKGLSSVNRTLMFRAALMLNQHYHCLFVVFIII